MQETICKYVVASILHATVLKQTYIPRIFIKGDSTFSQKVTCPNN